MPCTGQEERIVADLYGELEPAEREAWASHLAECEPCRRERHELAAVRAYVAGARPALPDTPRVLVLRSPATRLPSLAIAASLAAVGLLAGIALSWSWQAKHALEQAALAGNPDVARAAADPPTRGQIEALLDEKLARFRDERDAANATPARMQPTLHDLTRPELEERLARMEKKIDRSRADDLRYLLGEMEGVETRTGERLGETQQAIRYLALANDPRITEQ